jgi:hypothetical protein
MAGLDVLWGAFLAWFVTIQLSLPRLDSTQSIAFPAIYGGLGFALALSGWAVWMGRLGPVALTIHDGGLQFLMNSGRTDLLPWNELSKGVALVDYTATSLPNWSRRLWELRRWNRPPTDLTKEAFDAIVAFASSRGFSITSSFPRHSRWGPCRVLRLSAT